MPPPMEHTSHHIMIPFQYFLVIEDDQSFLDQIGLIQITQTLITQLLLYVILDIE